MIVTITWLLKNEIVKKLKDNSFFVIAKALKNGGKLSSWKSQYNNVVFRTK